MKSPYVVLFAGVPGSSKSIVAHHLSIEFNLPILNRDIIRSEVKEELLVDNINVPRALREFEKRYDARWKAVLASGQSIILDGSVDRSWGKTKRQLVVSNYRWFMIDMELSRSFFEKLFRATNRPKAIRQLDMYLGQHEEFLKKYRDDIDLEITDETFPDRLNVAAGGLRDFLASAGI